VVALEYATAVRTRRCGEWRVMDDRLTRGYGWRRVGERIREECLVVTMVLWSIDGRTSLA
jgi:hypothetical protein